MHADEYDWNKRGKIRCTLLLMFSLFVFRFFGFVLDFLIQISQSCTKEYKAGRQAGRLAGWLADQTNKQESIMYQKYNMKTNTNTQSPHSYTCHSYRNLCLSLSRFAYIKA